MFKILFQKLRQILGYKKISINDPVMSELIGGRITRRAILLALLEGKQ